MTQREKEAGVNAQTGNLMLAGWLQLKQIRRSVSEHSDDMLGSDFKGALASVNESYGGTAGHDESDTSDVQPGATTLQQVLPPSFLSP